MRQRPHLALSHLSCHCVALVSEGMDHTFTAFIVAEPGFTWGCTREWTIGALWTVTVHPGWCPCSLSCSCSSLSFPEGPRVVISLGLFRWLPGLSAPLHVLCVFGGSSAHFFPELVPQFMSPLAYRGHLGCFQVWEIVDKASLHICFFVDLCSVLRLLYRMVRVHLVWGGASNYFPKW